MRTLLLFLAASLTVAASQSATAGVFDDAEAYWSFDVDFSDTTGMHNGTGVGSPTIATIPGQYAYGGGALALNGSNQAIDFGDIPLTGDFSMAAWLLPENLALSSASGTMVFGDGPVAPNNSDWIRLESNLARFKFNGVTHVSTTTDDFVNGAWQHFALTRESGAMTVYRNGIAVTSINKADSFTPSHIGNKSASWYKGLIDEAAIWTRSLDVSEIADLYSQSQFPSGPALSSVVVANIDVQGDSTSTTAVVMQSTGSRVTLTNVAKGSYEPAIDGVTLTPANGVLMATPRANEVFYPAVNGMRYPTVEVGRDGPFASTAMALATTKKGAGSPERIAADTAMAWFAFEDGWVGAHVNADGTVLAGGGVVDNSMITYHEVVKDAYGPAPAYDIVIPGATQDTGTLFAVASSTVSNTSEQVHVASTMALAGGGWRVSILHNDLSTYPDMTQQSEFSFVYVPFNSEGLVAGHIKAEDGSVLGGRTAGDYTMTRTGYGTFELEIDGYTPDDGMLLLGALDCHITTDMPQDDWVTYAPSADGQKFIIWSRDLDGSASSNSLTPTNFVFAFVPVPEPSALVGLLVIALASVLPRRRRA